MTLPSIGFWLVHAAGSLAAGALGWTAGHALHRRLRLSHAAHGYWCGIWMLAVLPTLAALVLAWRAPAPLEAMPALLPLPAALDPGEAITAAGMPASAAWTLPGLPAALAALYASGLAFALLRALAGAWKVRRIVTASAPLDPATLPGPASAAEAQRLLDSGIALRRTTQPASPFAVRWPRPCIVLPAAALQRLDDRQLRLVLRHEAAHLAQRDPQRAALMRLAGALLWFNPFVGRIAARVQMAAELRCDAFALEGDAAAGRAFAHAYLDTLRATATAAAPRMPTTALTHRDLDGHRLRIGHMLGGDGGRPLRRCAGAVLAGGGLAAGVLLSMAQFATATPGAPAPTVTATPSGDTTPYPAPTPAPPARPSQDLRLASPVAAPEVTSGFGANGGIRTRPHRGVDFRARRGTPVLAAAAGTVVAATDAYPEGAQYGTVVVLDHGDGWQTLYAHLDGYEVETGQRVAAGERIARSGNSGRTTGPHLHMEALRDGQRIDPESILQ